MNTVSGRIVLTDVRRQRHRAAPGRHRDEVAVDDAERSASSGCISHSGSGYCATRPPMRRVCVPDRYWLTTRPVVSQTGYSSSTTSAGSPERAPRGSGPCRRGGRSARPRTAVACRDGPPRGSARTGPSRPRCAATWRRGSRRCRRPRRGAAPRRSARCRCTGSSGPCRGGWARSTRICQSDARLAGRVDGLVDLDDAPLAGRDRALVLLVQRPGQHDVGVVRRLGQEEVDDGVELELVERLGGERGVRRGDRRVEADRQQALDLARRGSPR